MTAHLARIDLYPIKSLDGISVQTALLLASGALCHDRTWALVDAAGRFVNAKRHARIHQVRSRFAANIAAVTLSLGDASPAQTFPLNDETAPLEQWFSNFFQQPVTLQRNDIMGFPDDTDSPGPTLISTATLQTVADWFGLSLAESRRRFRTNLEIDGVPAFWEDQLFSADGAPVRFTIGEVAFQGINPCQRCIVPTRDPQTGEGMQGFQKRFMGQRAVTLPKGVARSRFNHFYRLAINTRVLPQTARHPLNVGDLITLV